MKLDAIQEALRKERLDGWLFFDHRRRDPLAYRILGLGDHLQLARRWYYFIPAHGEPRGLVHRIEPHSLDELPGEKLQYSRWQEQHEQLGFLLGDSGTIAMQYSPECAVPYVAMVDAGTVELVRRLGFAVRSSADLVQLFEARWTDEQLESHLAAGRVMDAIRADAFDLIRSRLRDGVPITELEAQQYLRSRFRENHLVTDHGPVVAVNANASNPHYEPTEAAYSPIAKGDLVLIDMWAKFDRPGSVYYDITWTGFCGDIVPDRIASVFDVVTSARDKGIETVMAGVSGDLRGYQVDDAVRKAIESRGFGEYFIHRTGHSIGTDVHGAGANMDNFETHDERRITPGSCFSIEPGVYLPEFGIRSEVDVYVGEDGARVTGDIQRALLRLA